MSDKKQFADTMQRKMSIDGAAEWMETVIATLTRAAEDMKRRKAAFLASCDPEVVAKQRQLSSPVDQLSFFVNDLCNINHNLRLDLVPRHASALALTEPRR